MSTEKAEMTPYLQQLQAKLDAAKDRWLDKRDAERVAEARCRALIALWWLEMRDLRDARLS